MKLKFLSVVFLALSISGCGYIPVRTPFVISGDYYKELSIKEDRICILSWNIHKEVDNSNWKKDLIRIARVNGNKPIIILLQEVRLEKNIIQIFRDDLDFGWEFSPNLYQEKYDAYSGVLTSSYIRPRLVESALSKGTEPITKTPKVALFTKYNLDLISLELLVVNIHGINFKIGLDEFKEQLGYVAEFVLGHDGPVIMAGDFNTWSENRRDHLDRIAEKMNLEKVEFGSKTEYIATKFGNPLDHIFFSREKLDVVKDSQNVFEDIKLSDHSPLFVEFMILQ